MEKVNNIFAAARCAPKPVPKSRLSGPQMAGLAYERKVVSALAESLVASRIPFDLAHNPWFKFSNGAETGYCVPDVLLSLNEGPYADTAFVIEVKLSYVPDAIMKLKALYCPVVERAFGLRAVPVVICKHLAPNAPRALPLFFGAIEYGELTDGFALVQWLGVSRLQLGLPETIEHRPPLARALR